MSSNPVSAETEANELLIELSDIDFDDSEVQVVFGGREAPKKGEKGKGTPGLPLYRRLDAGAELLNEFKVNVERKIRRIKRELEQKVLELRSYREDIELNKNTWEYRPLDGQTHLANQIGKLLDAYRTEGETDRTEINDFLPKDKDFLRDIEFYAVCLRKPSTEGDQGHSLVIALRNYTKVKAIGRNIWALPRNKKHYNTTDEPTFVFDKAIDVIYFKGFLFIKLRSGFRRIFDYENVIQELARQALDKIKGLNLIDNFDAWSKMSMDFPSMRARLVDLGEEEYLTDLTIKSIKKASKETGIKVEISKDGKLVYDPNTKDMAERWKIIKILGDSFLSSPMTGRIYDTAAKTKMEKKT